MSTPISRSSKLEDFSLYAPRRVREGPVPDCEPATPPMSQESKSDRMREPESATGEPDNGWMEASGGQEGSRETEADEVQDRLEQAIREAVGLGRTSDNDDTEAPRDAAAEAQDEVSRSLPLALQPRRRDRQDRGELQMSRPGRAEAQTGRRLRSLDREFVREPRVAMRRNGVVGPFMRFSLVIVFAAIVAYGVTKLSSWTLGDGWIKGPSDRVATIASDLRTAPVEHAPPVESLAPSRLVVDDQQAFTNDPLPLKVVIAHPRRDEALVFNGLVAGTRLSAGTSTSASAWELSPDKLEGLLLYAPKDFVGVMNTAVDLIGADSRLLDSRAVQLKWTHKQTSPAPTPGAASVLATAGDHIGAAAPRPAEVEPIDPSEADFLMQQGRQALSGGDISAARVAFRRLADAGIAEAALAFAETYDPIYLAKHNVIGLLGDRAAAKDLYERARQLGSTEADRMLAQLGHN